VTLSFPPPAVTGIDFPDYRAVAERNAGIYVRLRILGTASVAAGADRGLAAANNAVSYASGFIADPRGYVVTAAHIALSTDFTAEVITTDGRRFQGRIVAVARGRELALIKIAPFPGMAAAHLADSTSLVKGEPAFAIGTPNHQGGVVNLGIVLRPREAMRIRYNDFGYDDAIALAMAIRPGDSGGPVFDREGRVIGMVASFALGNGGSKPSAAPNIAFAVPANAIAAFIRANAEP